MRRGVRHGILRVLPAVLWLAAGCGGDDGAADAADAADVGDVEPDADADVEASGLGTVQGYVILQGHASHGGVSVVIVGTAFSADSDATGFWSVAAVPPDTYTVAASLAGFGTATSSPFEVRGGETTSVPPLTLEEAKGSLSGTARLADATDHGGITVSVEGTSYVARTAAGGAWSITDVPVGNYAVRASHAGYDDAVASDQEVRAGLDTPVPSLTLRVTTSSIGGTVTLEGATDHGGVNVVATATWNPALTRSGSSNPSGAYSISGVEPGMWDVTASKTDYVTGTRENVYVAATMPTVGVDLVLAYEPTGRTADVVYVSGGSNGGDPDQTAVVDSALAEPFVVEVRDVFGAPVAGARVYFQVVEAMTGGHMVASEAFILTDASGRASDTYVLGRQSGRNHVRAGATGAPGVFVDFHAAGEPDEPAGLVVVDGDGQTAGFGRTLAAPLVTEVRDRFGNPVRAGHGVTWTSTTGGTVLPDPSETDAFGRSAVAATLGTVPAPAAQRFTAAAGAASVTFLATATPHAIDFAFPGRMWPGCPIDIEMDLFGVGFQSDAVVVWDVGGTERTLAPTSVGASRIVVTLPSSLFSGPARNAPIAVEQSIGGRCATVDFALGGVLPDTGLTRCFGGSGSMTCPAPGASFFGQDAQFGWDLHVTPAERFERTEPVPGEPMVTDRIAQLEWQGCAAGLGGSTCSTGSASIMEWAAAAAWCESLAWGGHDDWYLPNVTQLSGIIDAGRTSPCIAPTVFPATPNAGFWSSSSNAGTSSEAWRVFFSDGGVGTHGKTYGHNVRCVRRPAAAPAVLVPAVLSGHRVVRDAATGRMWQGCVAGRDGPDCGSGAKTLMTWQAALAYCDALSWAGHDDWRLPDRNELQSIVDYGRFDPSIAPTAFPATPADDFAWSSTTASGNPLSAWGIHFYGGFAMDVAKTGNNGVRCVRLGP